MANSTATIVEDAAMVCKRFCRYGGARSVALKAFKLFLEDRDHYRQIVSHLRSMSQELAELLEDDVQCLLVCAKACRIAGGEYAVTREILDHAHTEVILEGEVDVLIPPDALVVRLGKGTSHVMRHRA